MAAKKQDTEDSFVKANHLKTAYTQAKSIDPLLWDTLQGIREHYTEYSKHCEAIVQQTVLEILGAKDVKGIHSVRSRISFND